MPKQIKMVREPVKVEAPVPADQPKAKAVMGRRPQHIPVGVSLSAFADKAGISISYASQILSTKEDKRRIPTMSMAIDIYRRTGMRFGVLASATEDEIYTLLRMIDRSGYHDGWAVKGGGLPEGVNQHQ